MIKPPDNAKHPNTKALINRAIETCGLTQKRIAKICDVQQSVVSGWKSGKIVARWKQIRPLIEKYGDVQGERTGNTYCRITNSSYVLAEEAIVYLRHVMIGTYLHENSLAANSAEKGMVKEIMDDRYSSLKKISDAVEKEGAIHFETADEVYAFLGKFKGVFDDDFYFDWVITKAIQSELLEVSHKYEKQYVKIYGEAIFEYTFYEQIKEYEKKIPWMKWSIISSQNGLLTWVISKLNHGKGLPEIDEHHEHAKWISEIHEDLDAEEMFSKASSYKFEPKYENYVNREVLMFSLVHAFSQNGYNLEIVKTLGK